MVEALPEYPETSINGVAYVIDTTHMSPQDIALTMESVSLA